MKQFFAAALAAAALLGGGSAFAMTASSYDVTVPAADYVRYDGDNQAFQKGFPTGFGSALTVKAVHDDGSVEFYGLTDRGPNGDSPSIDAGGKVRPSKYFLAPHFQPEIAVLLLKDGKVTVEKTIGLRNSDGSPVTGLPPAPGSLGSTGEMALDEHNKALPYDDNGLDSEGLAVDKDGHFWVSDEYGPFAAVFDKKGKLLKKYAPGHGLPAILSRRTPNRGAEGLAIIPDGHVAFMEQSILALKKNGQSSKKTAAFTRLVLLDPKTGDTKTYAYPIDGDYKKPGNAKLGDIAAVNDHTFLIIEQGKDKNKKMKNLIYKVDITGADDISKTLINGLEPEFYPNGGGIRMAKKELLVDLRALGWTAEKAEGMALYPDGKTLAVINDNDFGVAVKVKDSAHPKAESADYVLEQDGTYTLDGKPASPDISITAASPEDSKTTLFVIHLDKPLK